MNYNYIDEVFYYLDNRFDKRAQNTQGITNTVSEYFKSHIDPNNKVASLLSMLAPGAFLLFFKGKFGWWSVLASLLLSTFQIDISKMFSSIFDSFKSILSSSGKITESQINSIVDQQVASKSSEANLNLKLIKMSFITKKAIAGEQNFRGLLGLIFKTIFKVGATSAGLLVAGDVINKTVGRPNAIDHTIHEGKPIDDNSIPKSFTPTQKVFPLSKSYSDQKYNSNWTISCRNNESSISDKLVQIAKEVYEGLNGKEGEMKSLQSFGNIVDQILFTNRNSPNDPFVYIPRVYGSKKELVDIFIQELANKQNK